MLRRSILLFAAVPALLLAGLTTIHADQTNAHAPGAPANGAATTPATPGTVTPATPPRAVAVDTNAPDVNAAPTSTGTNAAPAGPSRSYTVVKGDSLWKISHKMYPGDTKNGVDKIEAANPGINPKNLKLGSKLIIPQ